MNEQELSRDEFVKTMTENWRRSPRLMSAPRYTELMAPTIELLHGIVRGANTSRDDLIEARMSFRSLALVSAAYFRVITGYAYKTQLRATFGDEHFSYMDGEVRRDTGIKVCDLIHVEWNLSQARAHRQSTTDSTPVSELDLMLLHYGISDEQRTRFANGTLKIGDYVRESPDALTLPHPKLHVPHKHFAWMR